MNKLSLKPLRWATLLSLLCATAIVFSATASAKDGRDFAGFYEISNVIEMGDETSLTLTVQIFNYSDGPVTDAQVSLLRAGWFIAPPPADDGNGYGTLGALTLDDRDYIVLSGDFTVTTQEYQSWMQGLNPHVQVAIINDAGQQVQRPVELLQMPMLIIAEDAL